MSDQRTHHKHLGVIVENLHTAWRYFHLHRRLCLFDLSRNDTHAIHPFDVGVFQWIREAAIFTSMLALMRILDTRRDAASLNRASRNSTLGSKPELPEELCTKFKQLRDEILAHSGYASHVDNSKKVPEATFGDLRSLLDQVTIAIADLCKRAGLPTPSPDIETIDNDIERLLDAIHESARFRQLKDHAAYGNVPRDAFAEPARPNQ